MSVYLDGTHSAWQSVGTITQRLLEADVQQAQGFFLNVSNYQPTPNLIDYGTWISDCIAMVTDSVEPRLTTTRQPAPASTTRPPRRTSAPGT